MGEQSRELGEHTLFAPKDSVFFSQRGERYAWTYPQNLMKQSGDVEENPGPSLTRRREIGRSTERGLRSRLARWLRRIT